MHDPLCVAWEVPFPVPVRIRLPLVSGEPRWGIVRWRYRNEENFGEPLYHWWRPAAWKVYAGGRRLGMWRLATIWHQEPRNHDSGDICKHWRSEGDKRVVDHRWRWHVWQWRVQVHFLQRLRRRIFERCVECGRSFRRGHPGEAPIGTSWDSPKRRFWARDRGTMHMRCHALRERTRNLNAAMEAERILMDVV